MPLRPRHRSTRPADVPVHISPTGMDFEKRRLFVAAKSIVANMIADGALDYGLSFYGEVTTYTDTTHFKVAGLANKGTGAFKTAGGSPYEIYVFQADGAAPEGQMTPVVAYTSSDGTFQHAAFSGGNLAVGDIVLVIHPLLASLGTKATDAATGAVTTTDYLMAYIKQIVTLLREGTYGLSALQTLLAAITAAGPTKTEMDTGHGLLATEAKQDIIDTVVDGIKTQTDKIAGKMLFSMDFWSDLVEEVAVTGSQSTIAISGGDVVVADLPTNATVVIAKVIFKFRMVENTHATIANKLDAAAALPIQIDDSGNTGWLTCIDFVDDAFSLAATIREGGDVVIGDINVAARVDGNDTYDFQWLNAKADQNNLQFNDVQMGIRIWYSI